MSFGNIRPFYTNYGAASATGPGILTGQAQDIGGVKNLVDGIKFTSQTSIGATTATALTETIQGTTDTGTNPLAVRNYRIGASTAVSTRPVWQDQINGTAVLSLLPLNSGANAALSWGTQSGAAPSLTNRSIGTRAVLYSAVDATHADFALGVTNNTNAWISIPNSSSSFHFYAGNTIALSIAGDGGLFPKGPVNLKSYTVATLPASPAAGAIAYASDAGGNGPCIAMGNGSVWKRCDNTATTVA